jgi:hypothetical protein
MFQGFGWPGAQMSAEIDEWERAKQEALDRQEAQAHDMLRDRRAKREQQRDDSADRAGLRGAGRLTAPRANRDISPHRGEVPPPRRWHLTNYGCAALQGAPSARGHSCGLGPTRATLNEHKPAADRDDRENEAASGTDARIAPVTAFAGGLC